MALITPEFKAKLKEEVLKMDHLDAEKKQMMLERINQGGSNMMEMMGVSKGFVEFSYSQALLCYDRKDFKKALHLFHYLHLLNADDPRFAFALGATAQRLQQYEDALIWYGLADLKMHTDPMIACYKSECYEKLKDKALQKYHLQIAYNRCGDQKQYEQLKERLRLFISGLEANV